MNKIMEEKKRQNEELKEMNGCKTEPEYDDNSEEVMTNKSLSRVYKRDSMYLFGDDLTEQVIQYLWFSDKVMFECLSKQWQRLVFNKQTKLHLNYRIFLKKSDGFNYQVDRQALESLFKKCQNISRVVLWRYGMGEELDVITKYCRRVTKIVITFRVNRQILIEFGNKHGQWFERICL